MTVYMVAQVQVLDPEQWERYKEIASREIARHGGRYLTRGARPEVEEAGWNQPEDLQINIAAFPSLRQAHAWYSSPEYAKALAFRQVAVRGASFRKRHRRTANHRSFISERTVVRPRSPHLAIRRHCPR